LHTALRIVRGPRPNPLLVRQQWLHGSAHSPMIALSACLVGDASSALPPTRNSHSVVTAMASHSRSARCGSSIRVCCHCQPPLLLSLIPCSIQPRRPYQDALPCCGARSLRISHGVVWPVPHQPRSVPATCRPGVEKAVPRPRHFFPTSGTNCASGTKAALPSGRKWPPLLMRIRGCHPRLCILWNSHLAHRPR